jgi:hypothetical protein
MHFKLILSIKKIFDQIFVNKNDINTVHLVCNLVYSSKKYNLI